MPFERFLPKATAFLAIGGDNFTLDYGLPLQYFQAVEVALNSGKPVVLWGASIGPFDRSPDFAEYAARTLCKVHLICARESETLAYLRRIGVHRNIRLVADPAFVLDPAPAQLATKEEAALSRGCIGLNLSPLLARYWRKGSWAVQARSCLAAIAREFDVPILLIPHVFEPGNNDHAFMQEILRDLDCPADQIILLRPGLNASQLKWVISKVSVFIGARMHAVIAALASHVPTLSIGYSVKAVGINKDIFGHCNWLIPLEALNPTELCRKLAILIEEAPRVRQHLEIVMPEYKTRAKIAAKFVRQIIEKGEL
jgi:polysaccharide pyruvyl transferase WcaK-like protein